MILTIRIWVPKGRKNAKVGLIKTARRVKLSDAVYHAVREFKFQHQRCAEREGSVAKPFLSKPNPNQTLKTIFDFLELGSLHIRSRFKFLNSFQI